MGSIDFPALFLEAIDVQYFNIYMLRHQFYVDQIEGHYFSQYTERPLDTWDMRAIQNWETLEGCWGGGEQLQHRIRRSSDNSSLELVCMEQFYTSPRRVEFVFFRSAGGLPMIIHRYLDTHERVFTAYDRSWGALSYVNSGVVEGGDAGLTFRIEVSMPTGEVECWRFEILDGGFSLLSSFRAVHYSLDVDSAWTSTMCPPPYAEDRDDCLAEVSQLHVYPSHEAAKAASISGYTQGSAIGDLGVVQPVIHRHNLSLLAGNGLCDRSGILARSDRGDWQLESTSPFSSAALWASAALLACVAIVMCRCFRNRCRSADSSSDTVPPDVLGAAQSESEITSVEESSSFQELPAARQDGPSKASGEAFRTVDFAEIKRMGTREHWYIEASDLKFRREIASGTFGRVHEAHLHMHTPVAVKVPRSCSRATLQTFAAEIQILRRLRHPNIVLMQGVSVLSSTEICIVLEWVPGHTLHDFVSLFCGDATSRAMTPALVPSGPSGPRVAVEGLRKVVLDVARGLQYIHAQKPPILHRDLKPANVLVKTTVHPPEGKVADLGLSAIMRGESLSVRVGTRAYMAPEVARGQPYGVAADTYSFGLIVAFAKPEPREPFDELGSWCCSEVPGARPEMDTVLAKMIQVCDEVDGAVGAATSQQSSV